MENLRATVELDLGQTLESEWGMPVELTTPDGQTQRYSINKPQELLKGQVLYFTRGENPVTGDPIIVNQLVVTLRISSLIRVPRAGETWHIKCKTSPRADATFQNFVFTPDRNPEDGTDIGFIRIYPQKIDQEPAV